MLEMETARTDTAAQPPLATHTSTPLPLPPATRTLASSLVGPTGADEGIAREAARFGGALLAAGLLGVALGTRDGGASIARHALGAPAALLVVGGVGVPALCIALSLLGVPVAPSRVVALASRGAGVTGVVLAGLAPAVALFVVTSAAPGTAAVAAAIALATAGGLGLSRMLSCLARDLDRVDSATRGLAHVAVGGFALFAAALAARVWWMALPILHGGVS